jgi:DNA helicase-2/ATP-dependent DNA helicase PcrA
MDNPLDSIISNNLFINKLHNLRISKVVQEQIVMYLKTFLKSVKIDKPKEVIIKLINQLIKFLKKKYSNWQDRVEDLRQIGIYSQNYDNVQSFLDILTLNKSTIESKTIGFSNGEDQSPITLSTIHRAKGLEWKIVFIPMLSENLFPSNKVKINTLDYEEERRIFYVGITRAKEQLYLLSPKKIKSFKGQKDLNLSQFIEELNPKVYHRIYYQDYVHSLEENIQRSLGQGNVKKSKHLPLFTTADSLLKD